MQLEELELQLETVVVLVDFVKSLRFHHHPGLEVTQAEDELSTAAEEVQLAKDSAFLHLHH